MTTKLMDAKFESKGQVSVRCGGRGAEMVGKEIHAKTKSGDQRTVRLVSLVTDYGPGDVCIFGIEWN